MRRVLGFIIMSFGISFAIWIHSSFSNIDPLTGAIITFHAPDVVALYNAKPVCIFIAIIGFFMLVLPGNKKQ